jgi:putative selenium metabolism protein SsnA
MHATLLIGGTVVELDPPRVERTDVVIHGDRMGDVSQEIPTTSTVNCTDCLIVPGLVIGHTHLYSGLAAGMPAPVVPPLSFTEILEKVWWRLDSALDEEILRSSVEAAAIAAIRSGATCLIDHHESPHFIDGSLDVIAKVIDDLGLRALLTYGATDRHGAEGARAGLRESERFAQKTKNDPMVRGAIGLHAPFTCSDETLLEAAALAKQHDAWLHFHAAEGPDDQRAAASRWKERLVPHLDSVGLLKEKTILAHAVDVDDAEVALIEKRGAWVTHQPRSNMNNGVGFAEKIRSLQKMALGTDGIDNDLIRELQAAFFRGREASGPSVWPDPVDLIARGHRLASSVFGTKLGSLQTGAPADLAVIALDTPTPLDAETLGSHLLFGFPSADVRDLFVAGRAVMRNRRIVGIDERRVFFRAREMARRLWQRMGS